MAFHGNARTRRADRCSPSDERRQQTTTAAEIAAKSTADAAKQAADEESCLAKRKAATDMVGNLGADGAAAWALPMSEDGRSSIIRRHVQVAIGAAAAR